MAEPHRQRELTPNAVVQELLNLSRSLQTLSDELDPLERDAVEAKETYTVEYARKFLTSKASNNDMRKQQALLDTSDVRLQAEIAETLVKSHIRKIATLKVRIDVGRSAAALVRAEADLMTMGGRARGG